MRYIKECIDSALNQTFQDYEIIIRDNCSTDGSFEFVQENFSQQISEGKIKLFRNEKNIGEGGSVNRLFNDATGKYFTILHSDDAYLPHALKHLYEVAEKTSADVVHGSFFFNAATSWNGDIDELTPVTAEENTFDKITIMPSEPELRFKEWFECGTFIDSQYNLYRTKFILENEICFDPFDGKPRQFSLWWIMLAKVFVKTPVIFYIRRDAEDSLSNKKDFPLEKLEKFISNKIEMSRYLDKLFHKVDYFKDNEQIQYTIKATLFAIRDNFDLGRREIYKNGINFELHKAVEKVFKKYFGEDYFYPMFLFHWAHVLQFDQSVCLINSSHYETQTPKSIFNG